MKILRKLVGVLFGIIFLLYVWQFIVNSGDDMPGSSADMDTTRHSSVAMFGATGTIGDGILKALIDDPDVEKIHVLTRRASPRIEEGAQAGKVEMTIHMDYSDFSAIHEVLAEVDTVYWAIGLSAVGLDVDTYREIHADFPLALVNEWLPLISQDDVSFHYVSGSGANAESRMMWAQEKARAEQLLVEAAGGSGMRVISYRPSIILPTDAEAHLGHRILYAIFAPIKSAVAAESIGDAMLEVGARGPQIPNGTILENKDIVSYSEAYGARR